MNHGKMKRMTTIELTPGQKEYARRLAEGTAIPIRETFCRKCERKHNCWMKDAIEGKSHFLGNSELERDTLIKASNHECPCYDEVA